MSRLPYNEFLEIVAPDLVARQLKQLHSDGYLNQDTSRP